ncbi:MAG: hypothetical protein QG620_91 [Patescibacteria group bacterium]|nr:hypothetical protein [Patescibacteria group bacterium]
MEDKIEKNIGEESIEYFSEKGEERGRRRTVFYVVPLIVLIVLVSSTFGAVFGFLASGVGQNAFSKIFPNYVAAPKEKNADIIRQQIVEEDSAVIDVVEKATPAVVSVVVSKDVPRMRQIDPFDPFGGLRDFFGQNGQDSQGGSVEKQQIGGGSGFFITMDGMIVTNRHVVEDTTADYTVLTSDNKEHPASVLARDPVNDIAVIKIEGNEYTTLELGDSGVLKTGQTVIAIGNSLGEFSNTVSKGIISGLKRNVTASGGGQAERLTNIIQTDAAINPGNSGGPLIDINGQVIGVNVAVAQGAENIGFAIPSSQIKRIVEQVKTTGKISSPYIGVRYIQVDDQLQKENNLPFNYGALVLRGERMTDFAVIPGSPADKAGVVENDVILEIDGTKVDAENSLAEIINRHNVGDEITLKVWHRGETKDIKVKLEERK